jgi:hypothetical protein
MKLYGHRFAVWRFESRKPGKYRMSELMSYDEAYEHMQHIRRVIDETVVLAVCNEHEIRISAVVPGLIRVEKTWGYHVMVCDSKTNKRKVYKRLYYHIMLAWDKVELLANKHSERYHFTVIHSYFRKPRNWVRGLTVLKIPFSKFADIYE